MKGNLAIERVGIYLIVLAAIVVGILIIVINRERMQDMIALLRDLV